MAGYYGFSKSCNAVLAEREGKLPLSRAVREVARVAGCSRAEARAALDAVGPCEWHHTSKRYRRTDYYNVAAAVRRHEAREQVQRLAEIDFCAIINAALTGDDMDERLAARERVVADLAARTGAPPAVILAAYYGTWGRRSGLGASAVTPRAAFQAAGFLKQEI